MQILKRRSDAIYLTEMGAFIARRITYALLSMSYVLVWIASMVLPGWEGTFSLKALLGVACIMSGLMLIFLPTTKQRY